MTTIQTNNSSTKPHLFKRSLAGLFDYILICSFFIIIAYSIGDPNESGGMTLTGVKALIPILFWFIMTVGIEQIMGRTLGNFFLSLKPIPLDPARAKPTFSQSFKRHLLDPIDMAFFGLVGIVTIQNTQQHQRVGDIWAQTIVIETD